MMRSSRVADGVDAGSETGVEISGKSSALQR